MEKNHLKLMWIISNVICYITFIFTFVFVLTNLQGLEEINQLTPWVLMMFALLFVSLFGTYRIWSWMKQGKL